MKRSPAALVFCFFIAGGTAVAGPLVTPADNARFDGRKPPRAAVIAAQPAPTVMKIG